MNLFKYDKVNVRVELDNHDIFLIKEFNALMDKKRNVTKTDKKGEQYSRAFREFTYIYLAIDWKSPYFGMLPMERHQEALKDADLTKEEFDDEVFREACRKYEELQDNNEAVKLLKSAKQAINSVINYLSTIDVTERDELTGKPIFKTKDIIAEIKGCKDLISGLRSLEEQVKRDIAVDVKYRGDAKVGFMD